MTPMARRQGVSTGGSDGPRWLGRGRGTWRNALAVLRWTMTCTAVALVAACGGSDGAVDSPPPPGSAPVPAPAPAPAPVPAPVARVEIQSDSAWLPGSGQTRQLAARAVDAAGNPVSAVISWASSRSSHVAVDASGRLTSQVAAGSAQITAQAEGVVSAPLLAYVATPADGVVLVDDASIAGLPVDTDPDASPSMANTYKITLSGIAAPAVGTLLLGRGDKPLAGRVTAVSTSGAQTVATLQLVPLTELFAELEIEELLDLSRAEVIVPPDVGAGFDVSRSGNTWTFEPRATPATARAQAVTGTHASDILPFRNCSKSSPTDFNSVTDLPVSFDPPRFSITLDPTLDYHYSRRGGLTRFIVNAESKVSMSAKLKAQAALTGGVKCTLQLFALRMPIGGPLAFFVGGYLPVGVGFNLQAGATLGSFKVGAQAEAGTTASLGWNCPSGPECTFVRSLENSTARIEPLYEAPGLDGNMRLEASLNVFGYVEAELGNPFLRSLRFKALEARIGGKAEGSFQTSASQLLDLDYASKYRASLTAGANTGIGVGDTLRLLGFRNLTSLALEFSVPLAESPRAQTVQADRTGFAPGDRVNVKVALDPATLNFLPDAYNVKTVQLRRRVGDTSEVLVAQTASTGQQEFEFAVTAPNAGNVSSWSAFVVTRLLDADVLGLELGRVRGSNIADLPPIPEGSYHLNDETGFSMYMGTRTGVIPGQGQCEPARGDVLSPLPFTLNHQQSCSFAEGAVAARVEAMHHERGSGQVLLQTSGRFQVSTNHYGAVRGGVAPTARQFLVIMAPDRLGQEGTVTARFRVRIDGQLPVDFPDDCDNCFAEGILTLELREPGPLVMQERLRSGPALPPSTAQRPSIQLERDLEVTMYFNYGQPIPVSVFAPISMQISGTPLAMAPSSLRIKYEWLDFPGLPEGASVHTSTGLVWPLPAE